jgi:hypothetical protein
MILNNCILFCANVTNAFEIYTNRNCTHKCATELSKFEFTYPVNLNKQLLDNL